LERDERRSEKKKVQMGKRKKRAQMNKRSENWNSGAIRPDGPGMGEKR